MRELLCGAWLVKLMGAWEGRGVSAFLPAEKIWRPRRTLNAWINQGSNDTADWGACTRWVVPMGLLTALQGLFPSREHSTGEHARGRQAFQRQHTLTLFSAKAQQGWHINFYFLSRQRKDLKEKMYVSTHIYLYLGSLEFFFFFLLKTYYIFTHSSRSSGMPMTWLLR